MAAPPFSPYTPPAYDPIIVIPKLSNEACKALHALAVRRDYEPYRSFLQNNLMEFAWWDLAKKEGMNYICLICCEYFPFVKEYEHGLQHLKESKLLAFL